MNLGKAIHQRNGLRYIIDLLQLQSSAGRQRMLHQSFMSDPLVLKKEFELLSEMVERFKNYHNLGAIKVIIQRLQDLHDIQGTLNNLSGKAVLDDIELFEIKRFALLTDEIRKQLKVLDYNGIVISDLTKVVEILDPEQNHIPHFFIYDAYSEPLSRLRKKRKAIKDQQSEEALQIHQQCIEIEDEIRKRLSAELWAFYTEISEAWQAVAELDFMLARARLAVDFELVKPQISVDSSNFTGLFHPQVKSLLEQQNKRFQPWDIGLHNAPCIITGANMAGKTMLLKTIALNQYLFQFGFFVAAASAEIVPVEKIMTGIGDEQSELNGLSSFAAEMLNIQAIIAQARAGKKLLVLIDEPARTTNPHEGIAIANALIDLLEKLEVRSLITTHYSGLKTNCRKLRVKGLHFPTNTEPITVANINQYMDYSLVTHKSDEVPREALQIAKILGIDKALTDGAKLYADLNEKKL
ncbi:MAG: DNA mismatch repair protein MutS [Bacteroidales bacterium]|jgi:DNA mismatch repair ATPase MutS|nr:DNA mismatch repair protein MutS [Bacteroidales bacterium]